MANGQTWVGKIGASVIEGIIIGILNIIMTKFFTSMMAQPITTGQSADYISQFATAWGVLIFVTGAVSVVIAERTAPIPFVGTVFYAVGWIWLTTEVEVIPVGWVSLVVGISLSLYVGYRRVSTAF